LSGGHTFPQSPQFWWSAIVLTHVPLQSISPGGQMQFPPTQDVPPAQTLPHAPQSALLVFVSVHTPPQTSSAPGHVQAPPLQKVPPVQTTPQAPQLRSSQHFSTHPPLHVRRPGGQAGSHLPSEQTFLSVQACPHLPQ
jgi:hypothetical protein